jgi:hypothetical protein
VMASKSTARATDCAQILGARLWSKPLHTIHSFVETTQLIVHRR